MSKASPRVELVFVEYFDELGNHIETAWAARHRDEETLPDIACEPLARYSPLSALPDLIVSDLLDSDRAATRKLAPPVAFGEPGITMYYGHGFVIDVYYWKPAVSCRSR